MTCPSMDAEKASHLLDDSAFKHILDLFGGEVGAYIRTDVGAIKPSERC